MLHIWEVATLIVKFPNHFTILSETELSRNLAKYLADQKTQLGENEAERHSSGQNRLIENNWKYNIDSWRWYTKQRRCGETDYIF